MPTRGAGIVKPTTVDVTGTGSSATISANGSVDFTDCATVSLNSVFSADYDNYMIVARWRNTTTDDLAMRLRAAGTDSTATTDYNYQLLTASSTTVSGARNTANGYFYLGYATGGLRKGIVATVYGPYLSQPTAYRSVTVDSNSTDARFRDGAGTHELSSSYDGATIYTVGGNLMTGILAVYGLRN